MGAIIYTNGNFQGLDDSGEVVADGTLIFNNFFDGTPALTYKDSIATISNPYEIPLSPSGKADVYLTGGEYEVILKDKDGFIVRTIPRFIPFLGNNGGTNYPNREEFTANAGQTEFTLLAIPIGTTSLYVDGALQSAGAYSISGNTLTFITPLTAGQKVIIDYATVSDGGTTNPLQVLTSERNSVLDYDAVKMDIVSSNKILASAGKRITQSQGFDDNGQVDVVEVLQADTIDVSILGTLVGTNYLYKRINGAYEIEQTYIQKLDYQTMIGTAVYMGEFEYDGTIVTSLIPTNPTINARDMNVKNINKKDATILLTGVTDGTTLYLSSMETAYIMSPAPVITITENTSGTPTVYDIEVFLNPVTVAGDILKLNINTVESEIDITSLMITDGKYTTTHADIASGESIFIVAQIKHQDETLSIVGTEVFTKD